MCEGGEEAYLPTHILLTPALGRAMLSLVNINTQIGINMNILFKKKKKKISNQLQK